MVKAFAIVPTLLALSAPIAFSASAATDNVRQSRCTTEEVINPDGSGESITHCVTYSNGVK